jgi:hypothetical protein
MKIPRIVLWGLLSMAFILGSEGGSIAFHNGGVGECDGCHSMHNSYEGTANVTGRASMMGTGPYLLKANDASGACLNCHERAGDVIPTTYHVSTPSTELQPGIPPIQLTPGGDFGWLKKDYSWISGPTGSVMYSYGDRHGHNIVATDFLYQADLTNTQAQGGLGIYPSSSLGCTSCHDPHGRYRRNFDGTITTTGRPIANSGSFKSSPDPDGNVSVGAYRLLAGQGYLPVSLSGAGALAFSYDPPAAIAPDKPNRSEEVTQTRVAYGAGMSEWCQNCHYNMHTPYYSGTANLMHPYGATAKLGIISLSTDSYSKVDNYNRYIMTGNLTGLIDTSYLSLVPFEEGVTDYSILKSHANNDGSYLAGPDRTNAQVMCLSCHRAHASGWDGIMRWNTKTDFIEYNGYYAPIADPDYAQGRTETEAQQAYYGRPESTFAPNQDTLCNKCHNGIYP